MTISMDGKNKYGKNAITCICWCNKDAIHFKRVPEDGFSNVKAQLQQDKIRRSSFTMHF